MAPLMSNFSPAGAVLMPTLPAESMIMLMAEPRVKVIEDPPTASSTLILRGATPAVVRTPPADIRMFPATSSLSPGAAVPTPRFPPTRAVPVTLRCPESELPGVEPCRVTAPPAPPMRLMKTPPSSESLSFLVVESKYSLPWPAGATAGTLIPRNAMAPLRSTASAGAATPTPTLPPRNTALGPAPDCATSRAGLAEEAEMEETPTTLKAAAGFEVPMPTSPWTMSPSAGAAEAPA